MGGTTRTVWLAGTGITTEVVSQAQPLRRGAAIAGRAKPRAMSDNDTNIVLIGKVERGNKAKEAKKVEGGRSV